MERNVAVFADESLLSWLVRAGLPVQHLPLIARLNGRIIEPYHWDDTVVKSGDKVVVIPQLQGGGGGGGSDPTRTLLSLAVLAAAPYAAGALGFTAGTTAFGVAKTAIAIGGVAAVNAMVPARPPEISTADGSFDRADPVPTYSARGASNVARPRQPLIFTTNQHRMMPDLMCAAVQFYNSAGKPAIAQVFGLGLNCRAATDFKLGRQSADTFGITVGAGSSQSSYLQVSDEHGHLPDFADDIDVLELGVEFTGRTSDGASVLTTPQFEVRQTAENTA
ncbi:MAG: MoaD/ThiS family protein, partial [Pseudomonadota bacterium]